MAPKRARGGYAARTPTLHTDALFSFVAAGFGVSCAPEFICHLNHPGVASVELKPNFQSGIIAVWDPARVSATGRRFLEMLPDVG